MEEIITAQGVVVFRADARTIDGSAQLAAGIKNAMTSFEIAEASRGKGEQIRPRQRPLRILIRPKKFKQKSKNSTIMPRSVGHEYPISEVIASPTKEKIFLRYSVKVNKRKSD
jgi:hypothetical protein